MFILILTVISIFSLLPIVSSLDFQLNSPESVNAKESFSVSITSSTTENYDAKITVQDSADKIISEIYSDSWKNPFYYLKSIFPEQSEFKIRVIGDPGKYNLCVRLRKTGKTSFDEKCKEITVNPTISPDPDLIKKSEKKSSSKTKTTSKNQEKKTDEKQDEEAINYTKPNIEKTVQNISQIKSQIKPLQSEELNFTKEKIVLNSKSAEFKEPSTFNTSYQSREIIILYASLIFCITLIVLLALKKL